MTLDEKLMIAKLGLIAEQLYMSGHQTASSVVSGAAQYIIDTAKSRDAATQDAG